MSVTLRSGGPAGAPTARVVRLRPATSAPAAVARDDVPTPQPWTGSGTETGATGAGAGRSAAAPASGASARPLTAELMDLLDALTQRGPVAPLRVEITDLLGAWAAALVRLHRLPLDPTSPPAPLPQVLGADPVPGWVTELPAVAGRAWAVRAHPGTRRAVDEARAGWSASSRVHGAAGDDVVLARRGGDPRARLLPGAATGRGDARWDVASALDWIAVELGPGLDPDWQIDPVADFLVSYRRLGGVAEPTRALAVARTLATAVEWSVAAGDDGAWPTEADHAWLAALWARPLDLVTGASRLP